MSFTAPIKHRIQTLRSEFDVLRTGKDALLKLIDEAEISESVYNSNAIENSTLTLKETERILLALEVSRDVSLREVYEAKNLARVTEYIRMKSSGEDLTEMSILLLHQMLLGGIDDTIAGRFRHKGEYVRVGSHIAPAPEKIEERMRSLILSYVSDVTGYVLGRIAAFHLEFEDIHPFNDGNGRIGRVIINWQLQRAGFPSIIIRNKEKQEYYESFHAYGTAKHVVQMEHIVGLAVMESLHKRIAYCKGQSIIPLSDHAKHVNLSAPALWNAARRQTIPAFREKGVWMIGEK